MHAGNGGFLRRLREGFPEKAKTESRSEKQQVLTGWGQEKSIPDGGHSKAPGSGRAQGAEDWTRFSPRKAQRPGENLVPSSGKN